MNFVRKTVENGCIMIGENKVDLRQKLGKKAGEYEGKKIVFGFRPENAVLGETANAVLIRADVELTEMLGDNTNVYVNIGEDKAILKIDPHDTPETDAPVTFSIPYGSVYLFDGETEEVIRA